MQKVLLLSICLLAFLFSSARLYAQSSEGIIQDFLNEKRVELGLTKSDIKDWSITDHHRSKQSGATHVYIRQNHQGIAVANGIANFALKDGKVFSMGNRLLDNLSKKVQYSTPAINPTQAIQAAAKALDLEVPSHLKSIEALSNKHFIYNTGGISLENIPVQLMYFATQKGDIKLVWDLSIYTLDANHWWSVRVDAKDGTLIDQNDWVTHCQFDGSSYTNCRHKAHRTTTTVQAPDKMMAPDQYTVFALPLESASHGTRTMVVNPADSVASANGWHDTNGITGAEYTITRGNNVHAYEDTSDNNSPGYSPDGGPLLEFNYPYNGAADPITNLDAAITNLFYMNNMIHDVWYRYGFDEPSGNFQVNNFGNGGNDGDYVRAEAQDGSGTNNANFATPPDGNRPRMQMYIWPFNSTSGHFLTGNSPSNIAGTYMCITAAFGPNLPAVPITADLVLLEDFVAPQHDGCDSITNPAALNGKIVMIEQGQCAFVDKIQAAQDAGALAVVIANTTGFLFVMGGTSSTITIPSVMILGADANALKAEMLQGPVSVSLDNAGISDKDSDFDNGIIIHEYGHGISTRLCGGPAASNCLRNAEQMGEGWSDWFGLMMSIEPGDAGSDIRGIGTYVKGEPNTGAGIRPAPYSTDFGVNSYTYGHSNNTATISQPHGVGFIFATALWDLNWALVDFYGGTPDPDLYNGTGGNNIAMNLIIEGLKLQPCSPGMIDGRDAILQADQLLYNGAHECIIWEVFRNRGFGYSASQGSSASRTDQTEAFDLSPVCMIASAPPVAAFTPSSINSCVATIHFTDSSYSTPHTWEWNFGDGATSTQQSPSHAYISDGSYTITLIVTNNMGADTSTQQITITLPPAPVATDAEVCAGDTAMITAVGTGEIRWLNSANNVVFEGDTLFVPNIASSTTYFAENMTGPAAQNLGPLDTLIGNYSLDNSSYHGALNFRADQAFEIVSVKVYASGAGTRTFFLANGSNTDGIAPTSIVDDVSVYLQAGEQIVNLNLMVPDSGDYNLGTSSASLYTNTTGANYPYSVAGMMSINSSSAAAALDQYYYFYDLNIRTPRCISAKDTSNINPIVSYFSYTDTNNTFTFTDASVGATSWKWYFGDGDSSSLQNPVHTYATQGMYTVTLVLNGGTCISTQVINEFLSFDEAQKHIPVVRLMPNPTSGTATITLDKTLSEDLTIQISGMDGRVLQTANLERGLQSFTLNLEQVPAGMYIVRIQGLHFSEIRKLIKQ